MELELFVDDFDCLFAKDWHTESDMLSEYRKHLDDEDAEIEQYRQMRCRYVPTQANRNEYDLVYVEAKPNARGAFKATIARGVRP